MRASAAAAPPHTDTPRFGLPLGRAAYRHARIVGLTADLGKYTDIHVFAEKFPARFFQMGMAEQSLIGAACGLARTGLVPFATTYCVFATRRAYDFIAIGAALGRANVKIVAGLPGLTTGYGGTHQGIEDLALMRSIPGLTVIDPCDATETAQAVAAIAVHDGPVYLRLLRGIVPVTLDPATHRFEIGRARLFCDGADVAFISTGLMTTRTLEAARQLAAEGVKAAVLHVATLKPFDRAAVAALLARVPRVVTAENHVVTGGLASAVADVAVDERLSVRLRRVGLPDAFCASGSLPYLAERYGLTAAHLADAARAVLR
ncbi:MAG: transketolase family protein [Opitutales bacterium]